MTQVKKHPCVLSIAGSDSSAGAGVQADIKTISATGAYAACAITALTAQNTLGVQSVYPIPAGVLRQQIESVLADLNIQAVKIGMLFNKENIDIVSFILNRYKLKNIVLDPVMVAKGGCNLLELEAIEQLKKNLISLSTLITPNLYEAEKLLGGEIKNKKQMALAAKTIGEQYKVNVLIKGGHAHLKNAADVLYLSQDASSHWYEASRVPTRNTHGTGCTLSAAIASYLAQAYPLYEAISMAKCYLTKAMEAGTHFEIGHGIGPLDHFHFLRK